MALIDYLTKLYTYVITNELSDKDRKIKIRETDFKVVGKSSSSQK